MHETSAERQARALYRGTADGHPPAMRRGRRDSMKPNVEESCSRSSGASRSTWGDGALLTFGYTQVAIDAVVRIHLGVVFGAVVGFFDAVIGTGIRTMEAGITEFRVDLDGHGRDSE